MTIRGEEKVVKAGVLFALADTLAAHAIGGFKVGVGFSLLKCRACLATKEQLSTNVGTIIIICIVIDITSICLLRTSMHVYIHIVQCKTLHPENTRELRLPLFKEDSTTYGVNGSSPLNDIDNFHVIDHLPQDIMHVLFEGVVPYEITLLLKYFVLQKKFFTIVELNDCIESYSYSTLEARDKPSTVRSQLFSSPGGKLSQSCKLAQFV